MRKVFLSFLGIVMIGGVALAEAPTDRALGWENGVSYRMVGEKYTYQGILSFDMNTPQNVDTTIDLGLGLNVLKSLWSSGNANVSGFAGIMYLSQASANAGLLTLQVGIEPEYFIAERISASAKWGLQLSYCSTLTRLVLTGNTLGGLALNFYF